MTDIVFRLMVPEDIAYIKSTFLKSFRNSPFTNHIPNKAYFSFYSPLFDSLLSGGSSSSSSSVVVLAVSPEDTNHIYAWAVWEVLGSVPVLHYTYTKLAYRKFGIASSLLRGTGFNLDLPFFYTHYSRDAEQLRRKYPHAVHNPFILLKAKD